MILEQGWRSISKDRMSEWIILWRLFIRIQTYSSVVKFIA